MKLLLFQKSGWCKTRRGGEEPEEQRIKRVGARENNLTQRHASNMPGRGKDSRNRQTGLTGVVCASVTNQLAGA
jgi:hypothetical protein